MANKNWKWYVEHDDFTGALERFNKAYSNWKEHWFNTCKQIYDNSKKWAKKYILDPINLTIRKIGEVIIEHTGFISNAYVVKVFDSRLNRTMFKVGKANDIRERFRGDKHYTLEGILKAYQFDSEDKALTMENVMRSFFCHYFPDRFTEKDRFDWEILPSISEEMWEKLEAKINEVERLFVF